MATMDDLASNYAGTFEGRLPFGSKPALLIVDVVMAYLDKKSPFFSDVGDVLQSNKRLLMAARNTKIPVIFTNVVYQTGGANGGLFYQKIPALKVFDEGSALGRFPPSLQPNEDELIISKQFASAFFNTPLAAKLAAEKIDTVLISGFSTSGCVRATALDALQNGFAPFVVRDACGDRHQSPHEANLFDLQAKYAEVISELQAIKMLQTVYSTV